MLALPIYTRAMIDMPINVKRWIKSLPGSISQLTVNITKDSYLHISNIQQNLMECQELVHVYLTVIHIGENHNQLKLSNYLR